VKQVDLDIRPQLGLSSAATGRGPLTGPVHALRLHHQSFSIPGQVWGGGGIHFL